MDFAFEGGAGGVLLVEGIADERLAERSKALYNILKKDIRQHKKLIRYSHVETAQYEKMGEFVQCFC